MSGKKFEFEAVIKKQGKINAAFIEFPYDVKKEFNGKSRIKVKVLFDGVPYRGLLTKMNTECHILGITQDIRNATGKHPGDSINIVLEEDTEERIVEVPEDFMELMKKEGMSDYFNSLSFTHRKEYVRWIVEAKKAETREKRLIKAIDLMRGGKKTPD